MIELIAMFFCGFFCAAAIMACVIVSIVFKKDDRQFPTDEDIDQMCIWYEDQLYIWYEDQYGEEN